jgi:hypothetical protein
METKKKRKPPVGRLWKKGDPSPNPKGRPKKEFSLTEQLRVEGDSFIAPRFYVKAMQVMGYSNEDIVKALRGGKAPPKEIATMTCARLSAKLTWSDRFLEEEHSKAAKIHLDIVQQVDGKLQKVGNPDGTPLTPSNVLIVREIVGEDDET